MWFVQELHTCMNEAAALWSSDKENGKVTQNPHADPDQHQKIISTGVILSLAHAYHVWSTPVAAIVSYPAHRRKDRQTEWQSEPKRNSASIITKYICTPDPHVDSRSLFHFLCHCFIMLLPHSCMCVLGQRHTLKQPMKKN